MGDERVVDVGEDEEEVGVRCSVCVVLDGRHSAGEL